MNESDFSKKMHHTQEIHESAIVGKDRPEPNTIQLLAVHTVLALILLE